MPTETTSTNPESPEKTLELIHALNAVATALQMSIRDEENVYQIFREQVIGLGLRGGISELDEKGDKLLFRTVAFTDPLRKILDRFEYKSNLHAKGYSIPVEKVDVYEKVVRKGQTVFVPDTSIVSSQVTPRLVKNLIKPLLSFLGSPPGIFAPLIYDGKIKGMLNIVGPDLTERDIQTIQAFANQIAVALENSRLVKKLQAANEELDTAYQKTLEGWVQALDMRDNETEGHTKRTADVTVQLARSLGVDEAIIPHIRRGALLHDIGKMAIPDNILRKPAPLTETEWQIMKQHPQTAYAWLSEIDYLKPAAVIPYCHHEHWDGSGYVQGLTGEAIPYWARIFTVVDVWDAMSTDRPYRKAIPREDVDQYIRQQSARLFDPHVVDAFYELRSKMPDLNRRD